MAAPRVGRGVGDNEHRRPLGGEGGRGAISAPDVLTNHETDGGATHVNDGVGALTGHEVAPLIEHVVVGQQPLHADADLSSLGDGHERVADSRTGAVTTGHFAAVGGIAEGHVGALDHHRAQQHRRNARLQADFEGGRPGGFDEALTQQEIFGRIPGQGQFRGQHEIGPRGGGHRPKSGNCGHIGAQPTHHRVHLG